MTTATAFISPLTGELLAGTEQELLAALRATDDRIGALKVERRALSGHLTDEIRRLEEAVKPVQRGLASLSKATLPPRRARTPLQEVVSYCPRCGDELPVGK